MTRSLDVSDVKFGRKILDLVEKTAYDIVKYHLLEVLTFVHLNKNVMNALVKPIPSKHFSTHQKENCLRISKLTLLLIVAPFLQELQPLKHGNIFFGTPCISRNLPILLDIY